MEIVKLTSDERDRLGILVECLSQTWPEPSRRAFVVGMMTGFNAVALIRPKSIKSARKDWKP